MKIRRYTGSGVAVREAESVRANAISSGEAAANEMSKTRSINRGLAGVQQAAAIFADDNQRARAQAAADAEALAKRQQDAKNQLAMIKANSVLSSQTRAMLEEEDAVAAKQFTDNPQYLEQGFELITETARQELANIEDPFQREMALAEFNLKTEELGALVSRRNASLERRAIVSQSTAIYVEARDARDANTMQMAMDSIRGVVNEEAMSAMQNEVTQVRKENLANALAKGVTDAYRQVSTAEGDQALQEIYRDENIPDDVKLMVSDIAAKHRALNERTSQAEERAAESRATMGFMTDALAIERGEYDPEAMGSPWEKAQTTNAYGPAGSPQALQRGYQNEVALLNAQASAFRAEAKHLDLFASITQNLPYVGKVDEETRTVFGAVIEQQLAQLPEGTDADAVRTGMIQSAAIWPEDMVRAFNMGAVRDELFTGDLVQRYVEVAGSASTVMDNTGLDKGTIERLEFAAHRVELGYSPEAAAEVTLEAFTPANKVRAEAVSDVLANDKNVQMARDDGFEALIGQFEDFDVAPEDLAPETLREVRLIYDEMFDTAYRDAATSNMASDRAMLAAQRAVMENVSITNAGSADPDNFRIVRGTDIFNGDQYELNDAIFNALQASLDTGELAIPIPGEDGVMTITNIRDANVELRPVWTNSRGAQGEVVTVDVLINGGLPRREVEITDPTTGEKTTTLATFRLQIPAREMRVMNARRDDGRRTKQNVVEMREQIEEQKQKLYAAQRINLDTAPRGGREELAQRKAEMIAKREYEINRLEARITNAESILEDAYSDFEVDFSFTDPFADMATDNQLSVETPELQPEPAAPATAATGPTPEEARAMVRRIAIEENFDPDLAEAIAFKESSFQWDAVSPKGYKGLFQLNENFARKGYRNGVMKLPEGVDIFNPEYNIRIGLQYMKSLMAADPDDYEFAMRSYNWGRGKMLDWRKRGADIEELQRNSETYNYTIEIDKYLRENFNRSLSDIQRNRGPFG